MAELAPAHGASRPVQEVASQISAEQIPEIAQLRGMLAEWGQIPPRPPPRPWAACPAWAAAGRWRTPRPA